MKMKVKCMIEFWSRMKSLTDINTAEARILDEVDKGGAKISTGENRREKK
jgi:hypothetical protein